MSDAPDGIPSPINADEARCREITELMDRFPVIRQLIGERDAALAELAQLKAAQTGPT